MQESNSGVCHAGCGAPGPLFHSFVILKEHKFQEPDVLPPSCEREVESPTQLGSVTKIKSVRPSTAPVIEIICIGPNTGPVIENGSS